MTAVSNRNIATKPMSVSSMTGAPAPTVGTCASAPPFGTMRTASNRQACNPASSAYTAPIPLLAINRGNSARPTTVNNNCRLNQ